MDTTQSKEIVPQSRYFTELLLKIKVWGKALGFQEIAISDTDLDQADAQLQAWLDKHWHGQMQYMERHRDKRAHPERLLPRTLRIISARMNYLPPRAHNSLKILANKNKAYISHYALGRDYHKLIRKRLTKLAEKIMTIVGPFGYRAFTDSAPVFEKPIAAKAGIGWLGKNTLILHRDAGSWFFLGELYTDLPLPIDYPVSHHCGSCTACLDICPTQAIVAPYQLNATRCISYLTIENKGPIPLELRAKIGNRIFGCDDCQLICPWNKFAQLTQEQDFYPRHGLDAADLVELFAWSEEKFLYKTEGSAIRRATYIGWLRNIAVALGNAPSSPKVIAALQSRFNDPSELLHEHVRWALSQHENKDF